MIVSFRSKSSETLERFLKNYLNPDGIFMQFLHNVMFTEKKLTRINDIVVIEQESLFNVFAKYAMLPSVTLFILGLIFNYYWMLNIGAITLMLSIIMLSKHFFLLTIFIKLKISGHKEKIEYVSDTFMLSLFLMEYNNERSTIHSNRDTKK